MKVEQITLTPAKAKTLMTANQSNRMFREQWAQALANEMLEGRWEENGAPIIVDTDGQLVDGQHRCAAVGLANYSYKTILVTQVEPGVRLTIDDPLVRRFADDLTMAKQGPNATIKESTLRRILQWEADHGFAKSQQKVSRARLAQVWPVHAAEIGEGIAMVHKHSRSPLTGATGAFIAWLLMQNADKDTVDHFFSVLAIGSQSDADAVLVRLRDRIIRFKEDAQFGYGWQGNRTPFLIWLAITGWNAWLTGSKSMFALPRGRVLTNPFPMPVEAVKS